MDKFNLLITQLLLEEESAVIWADSYNKEGRWNPESIEEFGKRQGYVDGLRRAIDLASELHRAGTAIVPPI